MGTIEETCLALVTISFLIQGIYGFSVFVKSRFTIQEIFSQAEEFVGQYKSKTDEGKCVLFYMKFLNKFIRYINIGMWLQMGFIVLYFIIINIATKNLVLIPLGYILPYVNPKGHPWFELNWVYELIQFLYVGAGMLSFESFVIFLIGVGCCRIDTLIINLKALDTVISKKRTKKEQENIDLLLKDIFKAHQSLIGYLDGCNEFLSGFFLMAIFTFGLQATLCLFVCSKMVYFPGYLNATIDMITVLTVCLTGAIIEYKVKFVKICNRIIKCLSNI